MYVILLISSILDNSSIFYSPLPAAFLLSLPLLNVLFIKALTKLLKRKIEINYEGGGKVLTKN